MNFLKRERAPITDRAWKYVEEEAARALRANLSNRHVVDVAEPKGFDFSAVNLGVLDPSHQVEQGVHYGVRKVLPLVELRVPVELDIWELDNLERGATDVDTQTVTEAALKLASFEERCVYYGFAPAGIQGLQAGQFGEVGSLGEDVARYSDVVARAALLLNDRGVDGPFALVLGSKPFRLLHSFQSSDPPRQQIAKLLGGPILHSEVLDGGFVLSLRGGDFELTLGQDASLGYDWHDRQKVHLYLTESFTFRVLSPEAVVPIAFRGSE
jgi:uncharacterized linocin/CFP29 family protein